MSQPFVPASAAGVAPRRDRRLSIGWVRCAGLVLVVGIGAVWHRGLLRLETAPLYDWRVYASAGGRAVAGLDPYVVAGYYYTPAFAVLFGAALRALGPAALLLVWQLLALAAVWLAVRVSLTGSRVPAGVEVALAVAVAMFSPLVWDGLLHGNATTLLAGPLLAGAMLAESRPAGAGLVLGAVNALKPLGLPVLLLAAVPRRENGRGEGARLVAIAAGVAAAGIASLALGTRWMPSMLGMGAAPPGRLTNIALWVGLRAIGVPVTAAIVFVMVTATGALLTWRLAEEPRARLALAGATAVLALPVNNPSTFLLTLPLQAMALEDGLAAWRARAPARAPYAAARLLLALGACASIQTCLSVRKTVDLPVAARGALLLMPLLAVAILLALVIAPRLRRRR